MDSPPGELITALRRSPGQLWRRLTRLPSPERYTPRAATPENATKNNARLLAALRGRYGEATVAGLRWPEWACRPDDYLGCADLGDKLMFAIGAPVSGTRGPFNQQQLRQLGKLLQELDYVRDVTYYEVDPVTLEVKCTASHSVYWNDYEALFSPILDNFEPLPEEGLTGPLEALCERWFTSQGVHHVIRLKLDDIDWKSGMRAMLPAALWEDFDVAPDPERLKIYVQKASVTFVGRTFELPYLTKRQLTWTLFPLLVGLLIGGVSLISLLTPEAATPVEPLEPPLLLEDTSSPPLTWLMGLKVAGLVLTIFSPVIAYSVIFCLFVHVLAHVLYENTPLGTPEDQRYTVYVSGDT